VIINFRPNDPDSWRPPEEWEYIDRQAEEEMAKIEEDAEMLSQTDDQVQPIEEDFEKLKDQVKLMATASPIMILTRIKQIWSVTDENLHAELNMELKRWMLSILSHLDIELTGSTVDASGVMDEPASVKVMALYEPHGRYSIIVLTCCDVNRSSDGILPCSFTPDEEGVPCII
jgi:hypothetical protein